MDIYILLLFAVLIIGLFVGWLIAHGQASGVINELESRVRTAQTAAENAKLDFTNAQSELIVKDSRINTLNANIGILEERLRLAERRREEFTTTITRLQDELRIANTDRLAFEVELRRCHTELVELRAQLAKALVEADELRARIAAEETEREIAALRAQFTSEAAGSEGAEFQAALTTPPELETEVNADEAEVQGEPIAPAKPPGDAEVAPAADAAPQIATAELEARAAALQSEILSLRDGLATLTFAGAELVAAYEKRIREYEDRLARPQRSGTIEEQGITPAETAGGVDDNASAEAAQEGEPNLALPSKLAALEAELDAIFAGKVELEAQLHTRTTELENLQKRYDALRADLDAEIAHKAGLTAQTDAAVAELRDLRARLARAEADLDALLGPVEMPAGEPAPDLAAKLGLLRARFADLDQTRAYLVAQIEAKTAELDDLRARLARVEADLDALLGPVEIPAGEPAPDLTAKLGLLRARFADLDQIRASLAAQIEAKTAELDDLRARLARAEADLDALLGPVEMPAGEPAPDLAAKLGLLRARFADLDQIRASLAAQIEAKTAELDDLRARLARAEADLDVWLHSQPETLGGEAPADLSAKLVLAMSRADSLKQAKVDAEARIAGLSAQLTQLRADLEANAQARAELEARLQDKQAEFAELSDQLATVQGELDAAKQAKDLLEAQLAVTKDALQARQVEFDKLQEQLTAVTAERDALKSAVETKSTASAAEISADERLQLVRERVKRGKELAMSAAIEAGSAVQSSECPQDLAMTKGIGAVFEQRLYAAGIGTFWELANLTGDDLKLVLELDDRQLLRIDLDKIRADARRLAAETNSVGRVWQGAEADDFEVLEGIGNMYERKLYEAGICTYEALANTPIERLMEICPPTKLRKPNYAGWIAQARSLAAQKRRQSQ